MYQNQIFHGNVNPYDLIVVSGSLKIADYGMAQYLAKEEPMKAYKYKEYAAPELLSGSLAYDLRADMWSYGCIMYELCTGKLPNIEKLEPLPSNYSTELNGILTQMLDKNTIKRSTPIDLLKSPLINKFIAGRLEMFAMNAGKIEKLKNAVAEMPELNEELAEQKKNERIKKSKEEQELKEKEEKAKEEEEKKQNEIMAKNPEKYLEK